MPFVEHLMPYLEKDLKRFIVNNYIYNNIKENNEPNR
jgi:hypothetical protein